MDLALVGNTAIRAAIKRNLVSFPSQIPAFMKRGDAQERIVQLYFVRGWPMRVIGDRYGLSKSAVRKLLTEWRIRAIAAGYIQDIRPDVLAALSSHQVVRLTATFGQSAAVSDVADSEAAWELPGPAQLLRSFPAEVHL